MHPTHNPSQYRGEENTAFISSSVLKGLDETAKDLAIDLDPFLLRNHISPKALNADRGVLRFASVVDLLEDIANQTDTEDFGLRLGIAQPPLSFGLLTEIVKSSRNVGEALMNAQKHAHVYNQSAHWNLRVNSHDAVLSRHVKTLYPRRISQHLSLSIGIMYKALKGYCGASWQPNSLHFTQDPPTKTDLYRTYFRVPLYFNADFTGIVFDRSTLDVPIPSSNPALLKALTQHSGTQWVSHDNSSVMETRLKNFIRSQIGTGFNRLNFFANHIGKHPRTVQRNLAAENLSFRKTLNEIKCDIARHYLTNSSNSLAEISHILGYENVSAFSRAFTKETKGTSPNQYRLAQELES